MSSIVKQIEHVTQWHSEEFSLSQRDITYPVQGELFHNFKKAVPADLGFFYELIVTALFGGTVYNQRYLRNQRNDNVHLIKPDVLCEEYGCAFESKARRSGRHVLIYHNQLKYYKELQDKFGFNSYYCIFTQTMKVATKSYPGTPFDMFNELSDKTLWGMVLPLDILYELAFDPNTDLVRRYYEDGNAPIGWQSVTVLKSSTLTKLFLNPNLIIPKGKVPYYEVERTNVHGITLNNLEIADFPLLLIKEPQITANKRNFDKYWDVPF
jgi:hypothetical protein